MHSTNSRISQTSAHVGALALAAGADPVLSRRQTAALVGVSQSTLDRMIARGEFARPLRISLRRVGWPLSGIQAWVASRAA